MAMEIIAYRLFTRTFPHCLLRADDASTDATRRDATSAFSLEPRATSQLMRHAQSHRRLGNRLGYPPSPGPGMPGTGFGPGSRVWSAEEQCM